MFPLKGDEIRLLVLDRDETRPEYSLIHVSLASAPTFYALSYAWTDRNLFAEPQPAQKDHIQLEGRQTAVGSNLFAALEAWRGHEFAHTPLWVDYLCIDQDNIAERNHEVLRMYSIYAKAALVTVWLGPEAHDSHLTFDFMRLFAKEAHDPEWIRRTIREHTFSREWHAVDHLLHRSWWRRVWIIQEMVAAGEVVFVCGPRVTKSDIFLRFFETLIAVHATYSASLVHEEGIKLHGDSITLANTYLRPSAWNKRNLLQTIYSTGKSLATDSRDKIYGVMGLAQDAGLLIGTPDYSLSIENVYKQFAVSFTEKCHSLEFLSLAGLPCFPRNVTFNLPTWTPDWSHREDATLNSKIRPAVRTDAARNYIARAEFSEDMNRLTARGVCVDIIDGMGYSVWGAKNGMHNYQLLQTTTQETVYAAELDTLEALAVTFIANSRVRSKPYESRETLAVFLQLCRDSIAAETQKTVPTREVRSSFHQWYQRNRDLLLGGKALHQLVESSKFDCALSGDMETAKERYNLKIWRSHGRNRRLMITQKGYIGLCVNSCAPGDLVCVLFGCSTPVLLRRVEDHYIFLGEAYLHGMMNGEAMDDLERGAMRQESFCIW